MTDKKFTDEQIIKALEVCVRNDSCKECPINPNHGNYGYCTNLALTYALDLINRQKAEIERLQGCVKSEEEVRAIMKAQMYPIIAEATREQIDRAFALGKLEGIAEFAERLKATLKTDYINGTREQAIAKIDQIAKEMTEDQT